MSVNIEKTLYDRVYRNKNHIIIYKMNHPSCVSAFLRALLYGMKSGFDSFLIEWKGELMFPDACVPISGIITHYRENHNIKFKFTFHKNSYLEHCGFIEPFIINAEEIQKEYFPFDKIFRYNNSSQVAALTQSYIDSLSKQVECSDGVITGLIWCLNEIMDNVLVHSQADYGLVMAQYHQKNNSIAICVYDSGIGIFNSLKNSKHSPRTPLDAISLAIQEGIGDGKGQGNGLFGLYQIVAENNGSLTISSGPSSIMWSPQKEMRKFEKLPYVSKERNATVIDYRLYLNNNINIKNAFKSIGGFDGFDIRLDYMMQEDDTVKYNIFTNSMGTATRESGAYLRNDIINTMIRLNSGIILDFSDVKTASSSFVDELIAKLILRLGIVRFNQIVRLINMNDDVKFLCERSVYMRIHNEWDSKK